MKPSAVNQHVYAPGHLDKRRRALADIDDRDFQMAGILVFQDKEGGIGKNQRGADQKAGFDPQRPSRRNFLKVLWSVRCQGCDQEVHERVEKRYFKSIWFYKTQR